MPRERALGTAFRLLDLGFFRVGGEQYAEENGSYGLATIEKQHVHVDRRRGRVRVPGEVGPGAARRRGRRGRASTPCRALRARRGGGRELLAYRDGGRWRDLTSTDINRYVKEVVGGDVSAKDFRTWHGTVLAAVALAERRRRRRRRRRAARRRSAPAMVDVSRTYLGNTPTVARGSYVDPRVIDAYEAGTTIAPTLRRLGDRRRRPEASRDAIERAVLRLLRDLSSARRTAGPTSRSACR